MGNTATHYCLIFLLFTLVASAPQGRKIQEVHRGDQTGSPYQRVIHLQRVEDESSRRRMIGSTAPTCTYNECRGCKHKCRAEQVPVEANDPINTAYHYRCICHRY